MRWHQAPLLEAGAGNVLHLLPGTARASESDWRTALAGWLHR
jgi:hypothetical protein